MKVFCSCGEEIRQQWLVLCLTQQYSMLHMNSGKISCILGILSKWFSEMLGTKKMVEQIQSEKYSSVVLLYFRCTSVDRLRNCTRSFSTLPQFKIVSKLIVSYQKSNIFAARIRSLWEGNVFSRVCLFTGMGVGLLYDHTRTYQTCSLGPLYHVGIPLAPVWPHNHMRSLSLSSGPPPQRSVQTWLPPKPPWPLPCPSYSSSILFTWESPPQQPVQTCQLCSQYIYWQAVSWPSIERSSCYFLQAFTSCETICGRFTGGSNCIILYLSTWSCKSTDGSYSILHVRVCND